MQKKNFWEVMPERIINGECQIGSFDIHTQTILTGFVIDKVNALSDPAERVAIFDRLGIAPVIPAAEHRYGYATITGKDGRTHTFIQNLTTGEIDGGGDK